MHGVRRGRGAVPPPRYAAARLAVAGPRVAGRGFPVAAADGSTGPDEADARPDRGAVAAGPRVRSGRLLPVAPGPGGVIGRGVS